jgi:hypothetical protein
MTKNVNLELTSHPSHNARLPILKKRPNRIMREDQTRNAEYFLYTEDWSLIRKIEGWKSYEKGLIRKFSTYSHITNYGRDFAVQFRFDHRLLKKVENAAGVFADIESDDEKKEKRAA